MELEDQLRACYDLDGVACEPLNSPTNDLVVVTTPTERFALKLYNLNSRPPAEVEWEVQLITHLADKGAPVAKPVAGRNGYVESFHVDGEDRATVLFEWAVGEKPSAEPATYRLLGQAAAQIHQAAETFTTSASPERTYEVAELLDDQLRRMNTHLIAARRWQQASDLGERLKEVLADSGLDRGICHMDLTLDNVHRDRDSLTVFDFDSAGACWRSIEPHGVLRLSQEYFQAWLEGYRAVRSFDSGNERAVEAFAIIGDFRVVAWKLGVAKSSRGQPLLGVSGLTEVVDKWLEWEGDHA
jgi:Ser/Thr protein kinase RdoA (MazF antagonist)